MRFSKPLLITAICSIFLWGCESPDKDDELTPVVESASDAGPSLLSLDHSPPLPDNSEKSCDPDEVREGDIPCGFNSEGFYFQKCDAASRWVNTWKCNAKNVWRNNLWQIAFPKPITFSPFQNNNSYWAPDAGLELMAPNGTVVAVAMDFFIHECQNIYPATLDSPDFTAYTNVQGAKILVYKNESEKPKTVSYHFVMRSLSEPEQCIDFYYMPRSFVTWDMEDGSPLAETFKTIVKNFISL